MVRQEGQIAELFEIELFKCVYFLDEISDGSNLAVVWRL